MGLRLGQEGQREPPWGTVEESCEGGAVRIWGPRMSRVSVDSQQASPGFWEPKELQLSCKLQCKPVRQPHLPLEDLQLRGQWYLEVVWSLFTLGDE